MVKIALASVIGMALVGVSAAAPPGANVQVKPLVVPGKSLGPVELGMTRAAVTKIALPVTADPSGQFGDNVRWVGPYRVVFTADRVSQIEFKLSGSAGVRIGATLIPATADEKALARALPGCGEMVSGYGGNTMVCSGVTAKLASHGGLGRGSQMEEVTLAVLPAAATPPAAP